MIGIVGWDIGAANVKAALWMRKENQAEQVRVNSKPIEIWREKDRLPDVLRSAYDFIVSGAPPQAMAVTMTAELSDAFSTKREGVRFILDSLSASFSGMPNLCFQCGRGLRFRRSCADPASRIRGVKLAGFSTMDCRPKSKLPAYRCRQYHDRYLADHQWKGERRGPDGSGASCFRRTGIHGRIAHERGGDCLFCAGCRKALPCSI